MKTSCLTFCIAMAWSLTIGGVAVSSAEASPATRFFHSGNGDIRLVSEKNGKTFAGRYRDADGKYRPDAIKAISALYGAPFDPARPVLSLRLIEFLDYLEDRLKPGARVAIVSGYRAPAYNANLAKRGALAAKASLHQYGMAADIVIQGVPARTVWNTMRELGFGGAGYYHDRTVHVDVGPARFWDEKTSGVGSGASDDNKLIGVVTDYDVYRPGDRVRLRFIRMTAFPITLHAQCRLLGEGPSDDSEAGIVFPIQVKATDGTDCSQFGDIDAMSALMGRLPADLPPGRYRIEARFCDNPWEKMPAAVTTPAFEVRRQ